MANPIILYDSRFLDGTLSATDTASGYNVLNIKDYRTYTFWKAASAGTKYINVDCSPMVGRNFNFVQRLGSETQVRSLVSLGSGIVIAGTFPSGSIYRSTDNGQTWSFVQRLGSEAYVYSPASLGSGIVIAGTSPSGHIYRSTDNGQTWSFVQRLGSETHVMSLVSLGSGIVIAGTHPSGHIYRSTDNGQTWSFVQRLGSETQVWSLVSLGSGIVIAGTYPSGHIYRSTDNGQTWSFVQRLGSETYVPSLASLGNGIVIAGTSPSGHIYRSAISADCIGIIGHNLKSADALVSVESSPNNINWSERLSPFLPPSDKAFLKLFSQSYDIYWRIKIVAASAVPYIAVAMLGNRLTFPYPPDAPYDPYVESIEAVTNQSKQGHLLGSVIGHKRIEISARFSNLQRSWVMSGFKSFWDNHASDLKPFFYAWDIDNFPDMVFYVRVTDGMKFRIPLSFLSYVDSIELEMEGVKE